MDGTYALGQVMVLDVTIGGNTVSGF